MPEPTPLDDRLVEVALKLLEREGPEALSLRRVAREAGVSHGAPLRHFASVADLRAEVAARGFQLLSSVVEEARTRVPAGGGAHARMRAAGIAYVELAIAHPSLFALMFRPDTLDTTNEQFLRESSRAFEQLVRLVQTGQDAGYEPAADSRLLAGSVWAAFHGLASLWSQGALAGAVPGARLEDALAISLRLLGLGETEGDDR